MELDRDLALRGGTKTQTQGQIQETLQEKKRCLWMIVYHKEGVTKNPGMGQQWCHWTVGIYEVYDASFRLNSITFITELVIMGYFFIIFNSPTHG